MAKILEFTKPCKLSALKRLIRRTHVPARLLTMATLALLGVGIAGSLILSEQTLAYISEDSEQIRCNSPRITDGDTLRCGGHKIRLAGIDAPEMKGHCRYGRKCTDGDPEKAKQHLKMISRGAISCEPLGKDYYGRTLALCQNDRNEDLSCAMIEAGQAIRRYTKISC